MDLTDEQWELIEPLLPVRKPKREDRPGRTPTASRALWDGILWILRTGAQWSELPREKYPPYKTVHRWFQGWVKDGTFRAVLRALAKDLKERGGFDLEEGFVDAFFASAKKGGPASGRPSAARGRRSWQLQTALVFLSPLARQALLPTRRSSSRAPSTRASSTSSPSDSSGTKPMTQTSSTSDCGTSAE